MKILFLHRNFPGQFRHLAQHFAQTPDNQVVYITNRKEFSLPNVQKIFYELHREVNPKTHHYLKFYEESILHGQATVREAIKLRSSGFVPDIIVGHSWGNNLFMKDVFPESKLIGYFEWFYNAEGSDIDFGMTKPVPYDTRARTRIKNSHLLVDLYSCDAGLCPTEWQKQQYPEVFHDMITVIHEGVDTDYFAPDDNQKLVLPELDLSEAKEIVTYATRGMEPYRGFPLFMEAIEILQKRRPDCHFVIAGEDRVCYGSTLRSGKTYKQAMLEKLDLDMNRVHFTGLLPYSQYLKLLQCSDAHVYLTIPFVLSWSVLEAMATECIVIASDTAPVREVIQNNVNGLLVDFFSPEQIADKVCVVLDNKEQFTDIRKTARKFIVEKYNLKDCLQKQIELVDSVVSI